MKSEHTGPLSIVTVAFLAILASASGGRLTNTSMTSRGATANPSAFSPSLTNNSHAPPFCYQSVDNLLEEFNPNYSEHHHVATMPDSESNFKNGLISIRHLSGWYEITSTTESNPYKLGS